MASTVWTGHLTFGLVSLPVQLVTAARRKTVDLDLLHSTDHSRVRQELYCQAEDKPLDRSEIVKGFQYEKDRALLGPLRSWRTIVGVTDQFDIGPASRSLRTVKQGVEPVRIEVGRQRRDNPALWRSLLRPAPCTASAPFHRRRFQPHPDQPHNRAVHDSTTRTRTPASSCECGIESK
ncbi:MAG: Ku protein [Bryobacteraceae bacterium]